MSRSETQDQILDAVQSVIVRDGVRGASMRQVAQEADVSLGLLSYHFDDKDSLILAAFLRAATDILEACSTAAEAAEDPADRVRAYIRGAFTDDFLDGDYLRLRVSLWAVSLTDPDIAKLDAEHYAAYAGGMRALLADARPDLSKDEVHARVVDVIAASNGMWLDWARWQSGADLERGLALCEALALD